MEHLNSGIARFAPAFFNSPFTAADENLPLSMVRVKNKPQHLVFCSHFPHQPFKHRHLPVETSNRPCPARVCCARFASNLEHLAGRSGASIPQFHSCLNPSPARTPAQDAEPVHFRGRSVQVVDIWTGPSRICLRFQSATWPEASADGAPGRYESLRSQCDKTRHVSRVRIGAGLDPRSRRHARSRDSWRESARNS